MITTGYRIEYASRLAQKGDDDYDKYTSKSIFATKEEALAEAQKRIRQGEDVMYVAEIKVTDKVTIVSRAEDFKVEPVS